MSNKRILFVDDEPALLDGLRGAGGTIRNLVGGASGRSEVKEMPLKFVRPRMVIMDDLRTHRGLLVPRGFEASETFLTRLHNFGSGILAEKVRVLVPVADTEHVEVASQ